MTVQRHRGLTEQAAQTAVDQACKMLWLPTIRGQFGELADAAAREQMSYLGFLAELLLAECDDRDRRRSERRIKAAAFPRAKSLRAVGYDAMAVIHSLATCEWVRKGQPLCLIVDSGTGKFHLLIALGTEAAMKGYRVKYSLATKLVNELVEAADDMVLNKTIASNDSFDGWAKTFTDPRPAPPSSTDSPSTAPSSRPAPTPTALLRAAHAPNTMPADPELTTIRS